MKRKRILMVGPFPPTVGGITSCIEKIVNSQLKAFYEFIPFTTSRPTSGVGKDTSDYSILFKMDLRHLVSAVTVTVYHLIEYPFILLIRSPKLIHIHTTDYLPFLESSIYTIVAQLFSEKKILHIHATSFESFYNTGSLVMKAFTRKILNMADELIVLSPTARDFFNRIAPLCRITIIPNAIEAPSSLASDLVFRNTSSKSVNVLFVGGDEAKRKGLFDVLRAIPIVTEKCGTDVVFIFVGRYDKEKQRAIHEVEVSCHCIKNMGFLKKEEMIKVRFASDIYILPSYAEGLPITLLEAMGAGLPIVSTKVGSIPELIEEEKNGFLIEPGDYVTLAERIVQLAKNPKLRQMIGERNIQKVRKSYSLERAVKDLNDIYFKLV